MEPQHQTAVILLSDIQDFTKLVREDEEQALVLLNYHREIFEEIVGTFKGSYVHHRDDKSLAYFNTSASAIKCALEIQKKVLSGEKDLKLSMGLHRGEIIVDKNSVIGSSISLVSNIESLGCGGSIILSSEVYEQIKEKKGFIIDSLGFFEFQELSRPIEVFALANEGLNIPDKESILAKGKRVSAKTLKEFGIEEKESGFWRLILKRGVPQVLLGYLVASWTIIQFFDWLIDKYEIANYWTDLLLVVLLSLLPSVLLFVYNRQRIAKGKLNLIEKIVFPSNLILTCILILVTLNTSPELEEKERVDWAENEAPVLIQQLIDEGKRWEAYNIYTKAEKLIGDNYKIKKYESELTIILSINSEPEGASLYIKPYDMDDSTYQLIGKMPIQGKRIFSGAVSWMINLQGYDTLFLLSNRFEGQDSIGSTNLTYKLTKYKEVEPDMVYFPASNTYIRIPGIDHIERQPLKEFLVDKFEVTNKQFKKFVDAGGYNNNQYWVHPFIKDGIEITFEEALQYFKDKIGETGPIDWEAKEFPTGKGNYPVTGISWYEAAAFAKFVNKSLPTLYHWNVVATTNLGNLIVTLSNFSSEGLAPVGKYRGKGHRGTYDIAGNAREWCYNISNRNDERFILGGAYNDVEYSFTDAGTADPWSRLNNYGFRCINYLEENENQGIIEKQIDFYYRDFMYEVLPNEEEFKLIKRQYDYDSGIPLNSSEKKLPDDAEHWTIEKVVFDPAYDRGEITAYLFIPSQASPPYQTVIYFPSSGAISRRDFNYETDREIRWFDYILKQGRAVLFPMYYSTYEGGTELKSDYPNETFLYKDILIKIGKDLRRSVDYLETRKDIDKDNISYYGLSWGGALGPLMGAIENRLKCLILFSGGLYHQPAQREVDVVNFLPHVKQPVLMLNSEQDRFFPMNSSQIPMFELLGVNKENKNHVTSDVSNHTVPRNILSKEVKDWLDTYMGEVK